MTIRPGEEWGHPVDRPTDLRVVGSDAELATAVEEGDGRALAVSAGDLHRALGEPDVRDRMQRVEIDLLRVELDGRSFAAVAHVVARRSWWRGPILAVCNVDHVGVWNAAPRAHPNDGRFDKVEVDAAMSLRARWQARGRLAAGTHLPHPDIRTGRAEERSWTFDRPLRVWIDGVKRGSAHRLTVRIEPDAFELHV